MATKFVIPVYIIIFATQFGIISTDLEESGTSHQESVIQNSSFSEIKIGERNRTGRILFSKYLASLRYTYDETKKFGSGHFCAGTIIGRTVVLTAAHCLLKVKDDIYMDKSAIRIVIGTRNLYKAEPTTQVFSAKKYLLHPSFNHNTLTNDIALIVLSESIKTDNKSIAIAALPTYNIRPLTPCVTVGWGSIYNNYPKAFHIHHVDMIILEENDCKSAHPTKSKNSFCAYQPLNIKHSMCTGDSGAPLFYDGAVAGIVSRVPPCGVLNSSGVYTNVFKYMNFIKSDENQASIIHYHFLALCISYILKLLIIF